MEYTQDELREIISKFVIYGDYLVAVPFGSGNVNDTYQITYDQGGVRLHYILQRINHQVFKEPAKVMSNVERVTEHILRKIRAAHVETKKRTLRLLHTPDGGTMVNDNYGNYWRSYVFVENARAYDVLKTPKQAYQVAEAFGEFQLNMVDLPGERLYETIPDFHNTPKRFADFEQAVKDDVAGRASGIQKEIDFLLARKDETETLIKLNESGDIPERITHNDTKANNILIDDLSGDGVCVIDLDTVMPGLSLYDFGDMVRSGANIAGEEETHLDRVGMSFEMYEALYRGFLKTAGLFMTSAEKEMLPFAGKLITMEIGCRFLTDYLNGDIYFKTRRHAHNLDRARNQFKMVESIEAQFEKMKSLLRR